MWAVRWEWQTENFAGGMRGGENWSWNMSEKKPDLVAVMLPRVDVAAHAASIEYTNRQRIHEACKRAMRPEPPTLETAGLIGSLPGVLGGRYARAERWIKHVLEHGWDVEQ